MLMCWIYHVSFKCLGCFQPMQIFCSLKHKNMRMNDVRVLIHIISHAQGGNFTNNHLTENMWDHSAMLKGGSLRTRCHLRR